MRENELSKFQEVFFEKKVANVCCGFRLLYSSLYSSFNALTCHTAKGSDAQDASLHTLKRFTSSNDKRQAG